MSASFVFYNDAIAAESIGEWCLSYRYSKTLKRWWKLDRVRIVSQPISVKNFLPGNSAVVFCDKKRDSGQSLDWPPKPKRHRRATHSSCRSWIPPSVARAFRREMSISSLEELIFRGSCCFARQDNDDNNTDCSSFWSPFLLLLHQHALRHHRQWLGIASHVVWCAKSQQPRRHLQSSHASIAKSSDSRFQPQNNGFVVSNT